MLRKNVHTWMSAGGFFKPTPDILLISPEKHELLSKFPYKPSDPAFVVETLREYDRAHNSTNLHAWLGKRVFDPREAEPLLFEMTEELVLPDLIPHLPYSKFGYIVKQQGLIGHAIRAYKLNRMRKIAQLSYLYSPVSLEPDAPRACFPQMRFGHCVDVAVSNILIATLHERKLTELAPSLGFGNGQAGFASMRNTLGTVGIDHDGLTVARGDGVKFIDPKALDEDELAAMLANHTRYQKSYNLRWSIPLDPFRLTLCGYPKEEGKPKRHYLPNDIHDLSDKICYTNRDVWQFVARFGYDNDIGQILRQDPDVCNLWQFTEIVDGQLVITNPARLQRFLLIRILMFYHLYHGIVPRSGEIILGHCICGSMYRHGDLNMFQLLGHDDEWLDNRVAEYLGVENAVQKTIEQTLVGGAFATPGEARQASTLCGLNGDGLIIVEKFGNLTHSGTHSFQTARNGTVGTFAEQYPEYAETVDEVYARHSHAPYRSYGLDLGKLGVRRELRKPLIQFARDEMCIH